MMSGIGHLYKDWKKRGAPDERPNLNAVYPEMAEGSKGVERDPFLQSKMRVKRAET